MPENELLKKINKELKVASINNSEKQSRDKSESSEEERDEDELTEEQSEEKDNGSIEEINDDIIDVAEEQTDEVVDALKTNVLSSDPNNLTQEDLPVERNEIDPIDDESGVLNDYKSDKTSSFIDPDSEDENFSKLKVVDTSLGVFTILNYDNNSVLLLDSNKQKIQISVDDFNNLHPFEVKDDELENINSFKDALIRDKENEEQKEETSEEDSEENNSDIEADNEPDNVDEFETEEGSEETEENDFGFGESVVHKIEPRNNNQNNNQDVNVLTEIQQNLSNKKGVVETIRSDVRGKNRCVLNAKQAKLKETTEFIPRTKQKKSFVGEEVLPTNVKNIKNENKKKKEATQPSNICITPKPLSGNNSDFNVNNIVTLKDGKFVLVKLEGYDRKCYLKLKPKNDLSIKSFKKDLINVSSFFESLNYITDNFIILEKEMTMIKNRRFRKFESDDVEDQEIELDDVEELDEEDEEDVEELEDEDLDETDEDEQEEDEEEEQPESIEYSTVVNGVKYVGVLYAQEETDEESEESEEDEEDETEEDEEDEDLILSSEEELEDLDLETKEEGVINARAKIFGKRYNVTFCGLKSESVKKVRNEMRRHNIVEAWNTLVRNSKTIK